MRAPDRPAGQIRPCRAVSEVLEDRLRLTAPGPWPGGILLSHGLAVRALPVAQVGPFTGSADGVAAARGGELDQAGALLTGGRCAPWRPGQVHRPPSPDPDGMGPPRPLLAAFKSVRDSLSATVPTWTSSMSACYVTVIRAYPVRKCPQQLPTAPSQGREYPKRALPRGPGGVIECLTVRSDLRGE